MKFYFPLPKNKTMVLFLEYAFTPCDALFSKITPGLIYGKYRYATFNNACKT